MNFNLGETKLLKIFTKYFLKSSDTDLWMRCNYLPRNKQYIINQPEIDLIFGPKKCENKYTPIYTAEIKYIRGSDKKGTSHSYYEGLDEALALLNYGVDYAILIHIIDIELLESGIINYPKILMNLIKGLKLPIGYRIYSVKISKKINFFTTLLNLKINLKYFWIKPTLNPLLSDAYQNNKYFKNLKKYFINKFNLKTDIQINNLNF
ncbi:MAG: hypothetical protein ACTSRP_01245 [Candidatus Helarchaeota archaeon]